MLRDYSSLTRDSTQALGSESTEFVTSGPPGNSPMLTFVFIPSTRVLGEHFLEGRNSVGVKAQAWMEGLGSVTWEVSWPGLQEWQEREKTSHQKECHVNTRAKYPHPRSSYECQVRRLCWGRLRDQPNSGPCQWRMKHSYRFPPARWYSVSWGDMALRARRKQTCLCPFLVFHIKLRQMSPGSFQWLTHVNKNGRKNLWGRTYT